MLSLPLLLCSQCVGFVHGVLNTDNMSILGLTIDYGPYGRCCDLLQPSVPFLRVLGTECSC